MYVCISYAPEQYICMSMVSLLNQGRAWFLEITLVRTSVCVCVCVCPPPGLELCNTIDTMWYRDTKQYRSTSSFGIVGIDYATYNQTGDDFGSHFQLIWIKLVG